MGVPKFFRYMSERYPTLSQLVHEFEIPEFDNLYLDMNGIIHPCSHPNDFDPHFRITHKSIFEAIFHYVEFLFKTIKPQKLFFLAVDGVAPRAKMNQQRGRRFRSAKEAEVLEEQARKKGEVLPTEKRFDSNCITPGTVFMKELQKELEYFITMKISTDPLWQKCQIILSGHNTPGEGEHKVMDYIRYLKCQPNYDSNTRHCLYGLDADLIMLGMCTHDPNFCLLREEVKFTKKKTTRLLTPEETNFYLLHLSLLRDYLNFEFQDLKPLLPFPYNLESIIDDWVLMGFLVGNDFIPHLPDLHINSGALPALFQAYKEVLPTLDGYLNEKGNLNLKRFQVYLTRVAKADYERFEERYADLAYLEAKLTQKPVDIRDEKKNAKSSALEQLIAETDEMFPNDESDSDYEEQDRQTMLKEFSQHKSDYYRNKLEYEDVTDQVLKSQAEGYVRAIQWILHYYYHGCRSWSWFYPHHYSPFVSDVANFSDPDMQFDMGKPFLPFHQLLAVLPPASKDLLPGAYQPLMIDENSPIRDFYPQDFDTDLNGKVQEWESVVLIPFIEERRLLEAMDPCQDELSEDEVKTNTHGPMQLFSYVKTNLGEFVSDVFPNIPENHANVQTIWPHEIVVDFSKLNYQPGANYDKNLFIPGFSTLRFLPHSGKLKKGGVRVFERTSTSESVILTITKQAETDLMVASEKYLGQTIYVGWPHMIQAKVCSVSDKDTINRLDRSGKIVQTQLNARDSQQWSSTAVTMKNEWLIKRGIVIADVLITVNVKCAEGSQVIVTDNGVNVEKMWGKIEEPFALQTVVANVKTLPSTQLMPKTIADAYPVGSKVIIIAPGSFGAVGEVQSEATSANAGIQLAVTSSTDPCINVRLLLDTNEDYMHSGSACRRISLNVSVFNRITGTCFLKCGDKRINIGLNLKYNKTNQEVPGYTKKSNGQWLYSEKTVGLVSDYWDRFPDVFGFLSKASATDFSLQDIYDPDTSKGKDQEILKWIAEQPHVSITPVNCGSTLVSSFSVSKLETIVKNFKPQFSQRSLKIKPAHLYKSDLTVGNIPPVACKNELLDRVVCCRYSHIVPFSRKGYIIGIYEAAEGQVPTFEVLFDEPFPGGRASLGATEPRVCPMSASCFANITAANQSSSAVNILQKNLQETLSLSPAKPQPMPSSIAKPSPNQSPAKSNPLPALMAQPTMLSAFAPVNQSVGNNVNGHFSRPPTDTVFSNMWRQMQQQQQQHQPADALMKALNINDKQEPVQRSPNPCTTLMSYFERSPLGVPKYTFRQEGNAYVAQVALPNGRLFHGVPFPTRAGAGENAALQALAGMGLTSIQKLPRNECSKANYSAPPSGSGHRYSRPFSVKPNERNFPPKTTYFPGPPMPPSNWREQKPAPPPLMSAATGLGNISFVPLQAIRKRTKPDQKQNTRIFVAQKPVQSEPRTAPVPEANVSGSSPFAHKQQTNSSKPVKKKREMAAMLEFDKGL